MTDILDLIDEAVSAWEARPESWSPGDPLYPNPFDVCSDSDECDAVYEACEAAGCADGEPCEHECGHQAVRPMFEVLDDAAPKKGWPDNICQPCGVAWAGPGPCWYCGHYSFSRPAFVLEPWQERWIEQVMAEASNMRVTPARLVWSVRR